MFKLTVAFTTLAELSAFVTKMGNDVIGGSVTHDQKLTDVGSDTAAAAPKASRSRSSGKKDKPAEAAPALNVPQAQVTVPNSPFPGAPTNFAPGTLGGGVSPAPAQQVHQPAPTQYVAAPVQPPMAAPQAPAAPAAPVVSEQRKQYNDAVAQLVGHLQQMGLADGGVSVMANSFAQAGIAPGSRISMISDEEIQRLYPILHANISAAAQQR